MRGIAVAMDNMDKEKVLALVEKLEHEEGVACFKFNDAWDSSDMGAPFFAQLRAVYPKMGLWIDLKLDDIPNTMGNRARKIIAACKPQFITIWADNTVEAMRSAVEAASESGAMVLAVTILTSMGEDDCNDIYGGPVKAKVLRFARNAVLAGVGGIVCSAKELKFLNRYPELGGLIRVTPGIRPQWWVNQYPGKVDDQKRVVTAAQAVKDGAEILVMGRPIYGEPDPLKAVRDTVKEMRVS